MSLEKDSLINKRTYIIAFVAITVYALCVHPMGLMRPPFPAHINPYNTTSRCIIGISHGPLGRTFYTLHTNRTQVPQCTSTFATWHLPPSSSSDKDDPCQQSITLYSTITTLVSKMIGWNYYLPLSSFSSVGNLDTCPLKAKPSATSVTNTSVPLPLRPGDKRAVLITGIISPSDVYQAMATRLSSLGYDVLTYDLWARGLSDAPDTVYNEDTYVAQLTELLYYIGWSDSPVVVIGFSMGGGIAARFASIHPQKVEKLVLIAPAGLHYPAEDQDLITRGGLALFKIPVLGQGLCKVIMPIKMLLSEDDPLQNYRDAGMMMWHPGFIRGYHSATQNFNLFDMAYAYDNINTIHATYKTLLHDILVIWATADDVFPMPLLDQLKQRVPHVQVIEIENANHHLITSQYAPTVRDAIAQFLTK